jgi:hypothetical protein
MIEPIHQGLQRREIGVLLVRIERHLVAALKCIELLADPRQSRCIGCGIARQLQLEVTRAGVLMSVGDAALALHGIVEADGMSDSNARQRLPTGQKRRDLRVLQVGR